MSSSISVRSMLSTLVLGLMMGVVSLLIGAGPATAQVEPITAGQVMDDATLKQFVLYAKADAETITNPNDISGWIHRISDEEDWNDGTTFLIILLPGGIVWLHANDHSVNNANIYDAEDAKGTKVGQALLAAADMEGGGFVDYYWDDPDEMGDEDTAKRAYAASYTSGITGQKVIIVGGYRQDLSGSSPPTPTINPDELPHPEVTASEVMDRDTLVKFVEGSIITYQTALEQYGFDTLSANLDIFRQEGSPWRHGHTYLFVLTTEGDWYFHGANASLQNMSAWDEQDVNGKYFIQDLIAAAQAGGGFVEYHFDDPDVMGDEDTGSPTLGYGRLFEFHGNLYVLGSGLYFDLEDHVGTIELAADPDVLTEGETVTVTVTATQTRTEGALPVSVRMPLTLSGTAVENTDYTVTGEMVVTIPAEMTEGTTELSFDVADDEVAEADGETIIVTANHDLEEVAADTLSILDATGRITAADVEDDVTLKAFVDMVADSLERVTNINEVPRLWSVFREEGDWKHGDLYLSVLTPEGVLILHGDDPTRDGFDISDVEDDNGNKVVQDIISADAEGAFIDFAWNDPNDPNDDPNRLAYAVRYTSGFVGSGDFILVGGFNMDIPDPEEGMLPDLPAVQARDVVDKESLKAFVKSAIKWSFTAFETHGVEAGTLTAVLRQEDGPFREGSIYLFILTTDGYVFFHGADMTQEGAIRIDLEDLHGKRFIEDLINTAVAGGGFVEYFYDDPSVMGDEELGSPKVSYAETVEFPQYYPGQTFVVGAGFYHRPVDDVPEITLAVDPESVVEGRDGQEVTVTATLTDDPVPVATIINLSLDGTATSDDYNVEGTLEVIIPGNATAASTTLTFDVVDDVINDANETIVVKATYEGEDIGSATITVKEKTTITAGEVVDRETLKGFVETVADSLERISDANELPALGVAFRSEGDWKQGDLYLSVLTIKGEMFFHGDDPTRDGLDISDLEDDKGEKVVQKILAAANSGGGFVDFTWDDPNDPNDDPNRVAYATLYTSGFGVGDFILVGGLNMDIPDPVATTLPDPPTVQAKDVVDKETLKAFVRGTVDWTFEAFETHGVEVGRLKAALREEGGPFREGAIYLFVLTTQGFVFFHGADITQEGAIRIDLEDLNGKRFIEDLINVAIAGGGFVEYNYDDPTVEGDEELGSPKVSYAETIEYPEFYPGQTFVVGAGFYRRPVDDVPAITLEVDRETLVEGEDGQEVTVTATLTDDPVPVATIIDLTLEGTATSDDYTSDGTLEIIIPRDATSASTTLTFDVIDDAAEEDGETIVVKANYEGQEIGTTTISVLDVLVPPLPVGDVTAAEVMDRASLRSFVQAAKAAYKGAIDEVGFDHHSDVVETFRIEDGNWRLGEIYIFFLQTDGLLVFHGANPSIENMNIFDDQDLNGVYYTRELIAAAQAGGGYVEYYFDNPAVDGDEQTGSPKVSYTETVMVDGMELVIGSGFYFDLTGYVPEITLSVTPEAVSEDGGTQTVRVTATQTSGAIPITTVIPLVLSGTANSDDYSVRGNLSITIPGEAAEGSTELAITVINDDVYESGGETIIVTASYDGQDLDSATVTITDSYDAPAIVGTPPSVSLDAGESETINAGALFSGTDLDLSAATSDNSVATAVMSAATLTVTGVRKGSATVTVTARNAAGEASLTVGVTVTAIAAERMVYENILSAMGRNMLSSVSSTIGGRFSDGANGQGVTVGGRRIDGFASSVAALARLSGHGRQVSAKHLALLNDGENRRNINSGYLLSTSSFSYALEDGTANGGLRWSVWGAGDLQNFQGEPDGNTSYDGDMKTAYVGFDVATGRNWMAGIALSHAAGQSDYDVTVASGSLESRLTSVLPYLRWASSTCFTEVWSIVGLGTGEVDVEDATSDLTMRMAMVGTRMRVAGTGGTGLDVIGDAGLLRLSTAYSESPSLSDIESDVQRVRIGLEGSRATTLTGGTTITPYAQVAGRYDGGTGQTGQGLEVSGGLRLSGGRVGINAQGRFLAVHTADGYSENGFSVAAYLNPGSGGTGLSMSVAPRIGAGTGDSGMMWRDRPLDGTSVNGRNNARAFKAEVGYGLAYPSMGMLMTPFGEMYLLGDDRRQMRLGARLAQSGSRASGASLELSGMRLDRHGSASDHRIGLLARMSF